DLLERRGDEHEPLAPGAAFDREKTRDGARIVGEAAEAVYRLGRIRDDAAFANRARGPLDAEPQRERKRRDCCAQRFGPQDARARSRDLARTMLIVRGRGAARAARRRLRGRLLRLLLRRLLRGRLAGRLAL